MLSMIYTEKEAFGDITIYTALKISQQYNFFFQVFFVRKNPFIYGNQSDIEIVSSVMSIEVTTCENKVAAKRKKRSVS